MLVRLLKWQNVLNFEPQLETIESLSENAMMKLLEEYGELQSYFEQMGGYSLDTRPEKKSSQAWELNQKTIIYLSRTLGRDGENAHLAKVLLVNPDVLLIKPLDEPFRFENGLFG